MHRTKISPTIPTSGLGSSFFGFLKTHAGVFQDAGVRCPFPEGTGGFPRTFSKVRLVSPVLLLIRSDPAVELVEHVSHEDALPQVLAELVLETHVGILRRGREDRHVLVSKLVQDDPLEGRILAEPAWAVAGGHEQSDPPGVEALSLEGVEDVARGDVGRQAFAAPGVLPAELELLLRDLGEKESLVAVLLEGCREHGHDAGCIWVEKDALVAEFTGWFLT